MRFLACAFLAIPAPVLAADAEPPRAPGLALALAVEAAQSSIAACHAQGYRITVEVKDAAGITVAILSDDTAAASSIAAVRLKNLTVLKYHAASGEVAARPQSDPAPSDGAGDAKMRAAGQGAFPLQAGGVFLGAYGVAGSPSGAADATCAHVGLDRIAARLR